MRAWVFWVVLVTACSRKSEPPTPGSGSPVVTVIADATVDAVPIDAADLSAVPEGGLLLATLANGEIVIVKLDRTGLAVQHRLPVKEGVQFEWLDEKTLVIKDGAVLTKVIDGKSTAMEPGATWPPRTRPPFATVPAPPGFTLAIAKHTSKFGTGHPVVGTSCDGPDGESVWPSVNSPEAKRGYVAKATRWVLAEPPIFEVTGEEKGADGKPVPKVHYMKACSSPPLNDFIVLDKSLWAEHARAVGIAGTWTFRIGTREIATLDGDALRANRW